MKIKGDQMRLKRPIARLSIYCLLFASISFVITFGLVHHHKSVAGAINSSTGQVSTSADHQYTLGQTGPGGGTVFYYSAVGFNCGTNDTSTGGPTGGLCHYLEAAPSGWNGGDDPTELWVATSYYAASIPGITDESSPNNTSAAIGLGYLNSIDIVTHGNDLTSAAAAARSYTGGSKSDWYLPDAAELNQLCKYATGQLWISDATLCTGSNSDSPSLGLYAHYYWSSSESDGGFAWRQAFNDGTQDPYNKNDIYSVRPVRAF